jgi:hypothetical protein
MVVILGLELLVGAIMVVAVGGGSTMICGPSFFALGTILLVGVAPCLAPLEIFSCVGGLGDAILVVALGFVDTIWLVLLFFVALAASCRGSRLLASSPCLGGCRRRSLGGVGRWRT